MKGNLDSRHEAQQLGQLRARIETTFREPAMIAVTSAARGDGKSATAFGLAASLAQADHSVLLVDANPDSPTLSRARYGPVPASRIEVAQVSTYARPVSNQRFQGVSFADEQLEATMSINRIKAAVAYIACRFDFTIVDTGQLGGSNLAVLFSTIADGTLLTLRLGRPTTTADEETIKTLTRIGANVMGALTVTPKMIKDFRERLADPDRDVHVAGRTSRPEIRWVGERRTR